MSLALSVALTVATTSKQGVGFLSLDTHKHRLVQQLLAMRTGIDLHHLRTGCITDEERTLLTAMARTLSKAHLWIDDTPDLSLMQLRQRTRQLVEIHQIALLMVDNLYLIQSSTHSKWHANRLQEVGEIHRGLKALADELNIPVVVFAPIACTLANRHPKSSQRSDPRESTLEKVIDHVLFLYRDELSAPSSESENVIIGRIMITKHQHGLVTEMDISI